MDKLKEILQMAKDFLEKPVEIQGLDLGSFVLQWWMVIAAAAAVLLLFIIICSCSGNKKHIKKYAKKQKKAAIRAAKDDIKAAEKALSQVKKAKYSSKQERRQAIADAVAVVDAAKKELKRIKKTKLKSYIDPRILSPKMARKAKKQAIKDAKQAVKDATAAVKSASDKMAKKDAKAVLKTKKKELKLAKKRSIKYYMFAPLLETAPVLDVVEEREAVAVEEAPVAVENEEVVDEAPVMDSPLVDDLLSDVLPSEEDVASEAVTAEIVSDQIAVVEIEDSIMDDSANEIISEKDPVVVEEPVAAEPVVDDTDDDIVKGEVREEEVDVLGDVLGDIPAEVDVDDLLDNPVEESAEVVTSPFNNPTDIPVDTTTKANASPIVEKPETHVQAPETSPKTKSVPPTAPVETATPVEPAEPVAPAAPRKRVSPRKQAPVAITMPTREAVRANNPTAKKKPAKTTPARKVGEPKVPSKFTVITGDPKDTFGKYYIVLNPNSESRPYRFVLKANNGQILFESEPYKVKPRLASINAFKKHCATGTFEVDEDKAGNFRYKLYSKTDMLIGVGASYTTKAACESSIESVKNFAESATVIEDTTIEE